MPKIKQPVPMRITLRNMEITPYQWNQERVKYPVNKLEEDFFSLVVISLGES